MDIDIEFLLKEIVNEYGIYEISNPDRCMELLGAKYGDFLLISGIPEDLLKIKNEHCNIESLTILVSRLMVNMNLQENVAK